MHNYRVKHTNLYFSFPNACGASFGGGSKVITTDKTLAADTIYSLNVYSLSCINGIKSPLRIDLGNPNLQMLANVRPTKLPFS